MSKPHILPHEIDEAIEHFHILTGVPKSNRHGSFIDFKELIELDEGKGYLLYNYYLENPIQYVAALKDGYITEKPLRQEEGLKLFLDGKEVVVVHKKSKAKHRVKKDKKLPSGFDLVNLNDWTWYIDEEVFN